MNFTALPVINLQKWPPTSQVAKYKNDIVAINCLGKFRQESRHIYASYLIYIRPKVVQIGLAVEGNKVYLILIHLIILTELLVRPFSAS